MSNTCAASGHIRSHCFRIASFWARQYRELLPRLQGLSSWSARCRDNLLHIWPEGKWENDHTDAGMRCVQNALDKRLMNTVQRRELCLLSFPAVNIAFKFLTSSLNSAALRKPLQKLLPAVQMQKAYAEYNERAESMHRGSHGHFLVDLCRPGHMTACLRAFQSAVRCNDDNWDAQFGELPTSMSCQCAFLLCARVTF